MGSWWLATRDSSDEVDIVAFAAGRLTALGEYKWTKEPVGVDLLAKLDRIRHSASEELRPGPLVFRVLFSRSGFDRELRKGAADPREKIALFERIVSGDRDLTADHELRRALNDRGIQVVTPRELLALLGSDRDRRAVP